MFLILEAMVRWLAPILSFTAEEIWRYMPGQRAESVFFGTWSELPSAAGSKQIEWDRIIALRAAVSREMEKLRVQGTIGAPLDATVDVYCGPQLYQILSALGEELRFVWISSEARVLPSDKRPAEAAAAIDGESNDAWIVIQPAAATKCVRCWHKRPDIGQHAAHPELCGRCVVNVDGPGEQRRFA
jgi:isoleucyl-tRNA synthetase